MITVKTCADVHVLFKGFLFFIFLIYILTCIKGFLHSFISGFNRSMIFMTVQSLEDIKGYSKLSVIRKVRFIILLEQYLSGIKNLDNRNLDIISVKKGKKSFTLIMSEDSIEFTYILHYP